jgi:ABC-type lipoprotein export system ATPase subunit
MITSGMQLPSLVRLTLLHFSLILILRGNHVAAKKDNNLPSRRNSTGATSGLYWNDLSVQTSSGHYLLYPTHGFVGDGQICGILGPSGAGKTTFLSSVGGTISSSSGLEIQGDILYYDADKQTREELQVQSGKVAWMQQKDSFFSMLTVRETLELAALLELPHFTERQRRRRVQSNMDALGLTKLQHRQIGESSRTNGLSGGEQRRLSLALELIASPKLFIGDEPTSGLVSGWFLAICCPFFFYLLREILHHLFIGFYLEREGDQTYQEIGTSTTDSVHPIFASTQFFDLANVGFCHPDGTRRTRLLHGRCPRCRGILCEAGIFMPE